MTGAATIGGAEEVTHDQIMARVEEMKALGETEPRWARDPVNLPMINNWTEAIGDDDPAYRGDDAVAPPAMAQVWTMYGLDPTRPARDPLHGTMAILDAAGFTSVLGTNCDQTYARHLRQGERVAITSRLESVVGPKRTGVGEGYFVTTLNTWWVGDEAVATMTFRVLKFKPAARAPKVDRARLVRPQISRDTAYFWEGTAAGEFRLQTCNACGTLRHPPGPTCPRCHAFDRGYVVASGRGTVHSFVVHHAPALPGKELPHVPVLVDLEEGVRFIGELAGPAEGLAIGDPVRVRFERIDDDLTIPVWERADASAASEASAADAIARDEPASDLPVWEVSITPTLVVSTALATRDFQDVHHDRDLAVQRGSKDIFLNILTTTGLVQRYVGDWLRAQGRHGRVSACALRLGAPAYPGDTLALRGDIAEQTAAELIIDVVGAVSLGDHVTARVTVDLAETPEAS